MLNQFNVHLFHKVRIKVTGIEANSHEEAAKLAEEKLSDDIHALLRQNSTLFSGIEHVEHDESAPSEILVDPLKEDGEVDYSNIRWLDGEYQPLLTDNEYYYAITGRIPDRENEANVVIAESKDEAIEKFTLSAYEDYIGSNKREINKFRKQMEKEWTQDIFIDSIVKSKTKIEIE